MPQSLIDAANDVIDSVNAQKKVKPPPPPKDNVDKACEMKRVLLDRIEKLGAILPANTLDQGRNTYSVLLGDFLLHCILYGVNHLLAELRPQFPV